MKLALGCWLLAVGLLGFAYGQTACETDQWCEVFSTAWSVRPDPGIPDYTQNAWNKAVFVHDTGLIYQTGQANQTADGTKCDKANPTLPCSGQLNLTGIGAPYSSDHFFTSVSIAAGQPTLYTNPPYIEEYSAGMTDSSQQYGAHLWLAANPTVFPSFDPTREHRDATLGLLSTDSKITLCSQNSACSGPAKIYSMPDAGWMSLDDEVFYYQSCATYEPDGVGGWTSVPYCGRLNYCRASIATRCTKNADCATGDSCVLTPRAYTYVLTLGTNCGTSGTDPCRGQRTGAGWTAATNHLVNSTTHPNEGWAWLATPKTYDSDGTVRYGARINTYAYCNPGHTGDTGTPSPNCAKVTDTNRVNFIYERPGSTAQDPAAAFDGPTSRHQRGVLSYDSKRGKLWYFMGFQELTSNLKDLWWRCIYVPTSGPSGSGTFSDACTASDLETGWQHANLSTTAGAPPCCFTETDTIYLPDPFDVLIHFGGLLGGGHSDLNLMCLSNSTVPVKACHSDGNISNAASYVPRQFFSLPDTTGFQGSTGAVVNGFRTCSGTNCHGTPGPRDGPTLAYDPSNEKLLIAGGKTSTQACGTGLGGVCWTSVAQWNPRTSDYCLSDTSQDGLVRGGSTFHEFNGTGCATADTALKQGPLANTGAAPMTESTSMYFVAAAWNNNADINKLMIVKPDEASSTTSGIFFYDPTPAVNAWTRSGVVGGPPPHDPGAAIAQGALTLVHDDTNSMNWLVEGHTDGSRNIGIWELADSALTGVAPPAMYDLAVYLAGTGSGAVLDSPQAYINCGTQCSHSYSEGSTVTLTAQPSGGSTFAGWSGACSGTDTCTLTLDADKNVTATFNPPPAPSATTYSGMTIQGVKVQ